MACLEVDKVRVTRTVVTFIVCIWLVCATLCVYALGTDETGDTIDAALLLGATSIDILFDRLAAQGVGSGTPTEPSAERPLRIKVGSYIGKLGLSNVSYPDDPVSSPDNVAPLANYGQGILDQLDAVHQAAFLVGWYGTIFMRGNQDSNASDLVCGFAQEADFSAEGCLDNPTEFVSKLLNEARTRDP